MAEMAARLRAGLTSGKMPPSHRTFTIQIFLQTAVHKGFKVCRGLLLSYSSALVHPSKSSQWANI